MSRRTSFTDSGSDASAPAGPGPLPLLNPAAAPEPDPAPAGRRCEGAQGMDALRECLLT